MRSELVPWAKSRFPARRALALDWQNNAYLGVVLESLGSTKIQLATNSSATFCKIPARSGSLQNQLFINSNSAFPFLVSRWNSKLHRRSPEGSENQLVINFSSWWEVDEKVTSDLEWWILILQRIDEKLIETCFGRHYQGSKIGTVSPTQPWPCFSSTSSSFLTAPVTSCRSFMIDVIV